ncbi:MAG TPA: NADH-quinone oxidoreductase subunit NuoE [Candidatus Hydrogenedentes bacterium]|nr:NADH-quinone oxidoreductase subunit NuoE [Candidatus Hydrogenedentota bacterium]HOJ67546.1 NADH-quinone oxidoreductase subunit NuoE [Candidatus Hydrogenedentota bacterium]HOK89135.1 NADH-quinone oxidoreductase subunit NuoE [Candidatus Hydrogenedentota bacterium]HOV59880.1 NADH-quinone oxidoreductase subunit NuoE [Candidatus Hydrogenedentota bacterium]HPO30078.1 NADH-quinone oxidoreductase subunit NuoE [Candidatus Hydrogenedentota bacterium]
MSTHCCCNGSTDNSEAVMAAARAALTPEIVDFIKTCRADEHPEGQLIRVLHKVQEHYGYLGQDQLNAVAQLLQVPTSKVTGVATFYHFFRTEPRGRYVISVCLGTACYVKGAERVSEKLSEELGIHFGETTKDGLFSLNATRCLGTCSLAPVVMVNDEVFGDMTPDKVPALLEQYARKAQKEGQG